MLLLVSAALAHPDSLPHLHSTDSLALGMTAFWIAVGLAWLGVAARSSSLAASE